ncbi:MAG: helix-turn-helix domain-containing protein [Acidimicrobiales bacterium]
MSLSGGDIGDGSRGVSSSPVLTELRATFEEFGLNGYEAIVLLALLQLGSATARDLARVANVGRTHVYPVLEALRERGLARQLAGKLSVWQSPGREEVLDRLCATEEERLLSLAARKRHAQEMLDRLATQQSIATPYVHTLSGADQVSETHRQLFAEASTEMLMFTLRPYSSVPPTTDPMILEAVGRGVSVRVLYVVAEYQDPSTAALREVWAEYHRLGVQGRMSDELPMKLMISDRRAVLHTLSDPVLPEVGFPTSQLIRHPGFASFLAAAFESSWSSSLPLAEL